ncbi:unnamed protein product [Hymenolepis diminuta]|uniref:Uncharacterized protein n=1 Tax=Hymenolepis diminuta TaxID=6216 RepID=A0A564Y6N9_HYMDI|nr:unnamed protein product [Hymenolepis diminuta]
MQSPNSNVSASRLILMLLLLKLNAQMKVSVHLNSEFQIYKAEFEAQLSFLEWSRSADHQIFLKSVQLMYHFFKRNNDNLRTAYRIWPREQILVAQKLISLCRYFEPFVMQKIISRALLWIWLGVVINSEVWHLKIKFKCVKSSLTSKLTETEHSNTLDIIFHSFNLLLLNTQVTVPE